ncbi:MAG: zf-HC2 domain-containing protein [Thermoguttaceae bacterium]
MKCEEILAALNDYVDGQLDPDVCEALQEHLVDCNPCQIVVDNIRQTITLYKSGEPLQLPAALSQQLSGILRDRWRMKFPSADA